MTSMNSQSAWALLKAKSNTWDFATYELAKQLLCALREAHVSDIDPDLVHCITEIRQFHYDRFIEISPDFEILVFSN